MIACAVVIAGAIVALRDGGAGRATEPLKPAPRTSDGAENVQRVPELERAPRTDEQLAAAGGNPADEPRRGSFEGHGTLRGEIVAARGAVFPERWTLVLEGSPVLQGRERAAARRIEFAHGERTFTVDDLPLAGYRVRAEAPGLNGAPAEVLLVATSPAAFVTLPFAPAGFVDGQVRLADGSPAEGLAVTLEDAKTRARMAAVCDVNGAYVLHDVVDGEYRLFLGPPEAPLLPPRDLVFHAPSLRMREERLPVVSGLRILVLDDHKSPVPGAVVTGSSSTGGAFEVTSEASGIARAHFLLPGTWRIEARIDRRASGRQTVEVGEGVDAEVTVRVLD